LLATVSSHSPHGDRSKRWREISIYRQSDGSYVIYSVGRSLFEDESDRYTVELAAHVEAVMDLLVPNNQKPRFMVADLLYAAEEKDPTFLRVLDRLEVEDLGPLTDEKGEMLVDERGQLLVPEGDLFELPRENDRAFRFRGVLLAHQSSRLGDAPKWTEIKIFRVAPSAEALAKRGGVTRGATRYIVWKAKCQVGVDEPSHAVVAIVQTGLAAMRALIRKGKSWLESAAYDALADAAERDPFFDQTLDDMLNDLRFRQMLADVPELSRAQIDVLSRLAAGKYLVTQQSAEDSRSTRRVIGWRGDLTSPPAVWQVFLGLSRQRLIRRRNAIDELEGEWEITDLGRKALDASGDARAKR
jgi:hypothetical protein